LPGAAVLPGPVGVALLRAAPAVGALAMSFWLASHPLHAAGRALFLGVALFGLATLALGLSRSLPLSLAILLLLGAADMVSVVIRQTLVQLHTPDEMRGRVSSVNAIFIGASNQLGEFESGLTAALLGPVGSVLLGGIGSIPGAMLGGVLLGVAETLAAAYLSSEYKDIVAFVLLVLILMVRPTGLLGKPEVEKV